MTDAERIKALEAALEYALNRCDELMDDEYGRPDTSEETLAAKTLLPNAKFPVYEEWSK